MPVTVVDILPDARELMLGDPAPESVVGDLVLHNVHEAGVVGHSIADELKVSASHAGELANVEAEAIAKCLAAELVRDAEGVAGVDHSATEGEGTVGGQEVVGDSFGVVDVAVVDVLENELACLAVEAAECDFKLDTLVAGLAGLAGLHINLHELVASDEGEVGELGAVVAGAEEGLFEWSGVVEDIRAASGGWSVGRLLAREGVFRGVLDLLESGGDLFRPGDLSSDPGGALGVARSRVRA